ncbi:MAG: EVE domain-containing protein [Tabrizicola sp.]
MTDARPPKSWIAVASADHAAIGWAAGFMQVNHGKAGPLRRMQAGDRVICYAPVQAYRGTERLQAFVAHGRIAPGEVYQGSMGEGSGPWRRDVIWNEARTAPIVPLLDRLSFTAGRKNWGQPFRWGFFEVSEDDARIITVAMGVAG